MSIPITILNKFIHGAWQGIIKIEEFIVVDKKVLSFYPGEGPTYSLIFKDVKTNKYYQLVYTVVYKKSIFVSEKVKMKPLEEVFPEKKETTVYVPASEILKSVHEKFEEFYGQ